MNPNVSTRSGERGNLILVAMIVGGVAGITLASYLMLAQQQNLSIYRSQAWNSCMVVAEGGVEDGLQLINLYAGSFNEMDIFKWTNHAAGANWDHPSPTVYHTSRTITNGVLPGQTPNSYEVWIFNTNKNMPFVYAEGRVPWTYGVTAAQQPMFAQVRPKVAATSVGSIVRRVAVKTQYDPLFVVAMAATGNIDLNGRRIRSNSFDSADPRYSTNHFYPFNNPNMTKDNGDICTDAGLVDSLEVGNAHIRGHVRTGPGTNTISIQNGSVGSRAWVESDTRGIEQGASSTDFNVAFPDVVVDTSSWLSVGQANYSTNGTTYKYYFSSAGGWVIDNPVNASILIDAPPDAVVNIRINSNVSLTGQDVIRIRPTGARVRIFMAGSSFSLSGNAFIDNQTGIANNFYLYGLPSCTSIDFGGNASFYGGIYAPEAAFHLGGGGNNDYDFIGGSVSRTVQMNGHFNFHYDEDLARVGPARGYIPVAWEEK